MAARLRPNLGKILEAILLLIEEAGRDGYRLTQYEIVKSIFIADYYHLKKFGRPISFDNYSAMRFGPVPSETYEMLKPSYPGQRFFGEEWPFWKSVAAPNRGAKACEFTEPRRRANRRKLSETDVSQLVEALLFVRKVGFDGVKDWTHMLPAYSEAWNSRGEKRSKEMDYERLLEKSDKDLVAELAHASKHM